MPRLSPQVFAILSGLVEEKLGLHHEAPDADTFADKIAPRLAERGFQSALDYYYFLRYDPAAGPELEALADLLVVGETYFFRELAPLRAAMERVVLPAVTRLGRARIWSAGCATGEEPLTVAMVAAELGVLEHVAIVATDVSNRALERARRGRYGGRSFRAIDSSAVADELTVVARGLAARWLQGEPPSVAPEIRAAVDFRAVNLVDDGAVAALGEFDLVLCRNVLIYFDDATVREVASRIAGTLAPGGRLLVGASESLLRFGTMLRCEERGGAFLYGREP